MSTTIDTGLTEGDLLSELAAQLEQDCQQLCEGDVTVSILCERTGQSRGRVERLLKGKVKAGLLVVVQVLERGKRVNAYRRAK